MLDEPPVSVSKPSELDADLPRSRRPWAKRVLFGFIIALPLLGLLELSGQVHAMGRAPSLEEWRSVRDEVRRLKGEGDLVLASPAWAEPNLRHALGDELMPLAEVARPDESSFKRVIEVSALGETNPLISSWKIIEELEVGRLTLKVRENPAPASPRFDFVEGLAPERASVFTEASLGSGQQTDCPYTGSAPFASGSLGGPPTFPAERFACGGGDWQFVGVTVIDDSNEYRPRRCLWAHPTKYGNISVRFRQVPLGQVIRGYGQLPWLQERLWQGAPVHLRVQVGGREIGEFVHRDGEGWKPFEFPLGDMANTTQDVQFQVSAKSPAQRHFCFQADTR